MCSTPNGIDGTSVYGVSISKPAMQPVVFGKDLPGYEIGEKALPAVIVVQVVSAVS